ncbi:MAG: class I SAM-dependent methyltransferase [Pyrinomonadaceae bacterium]
MSRLLWEEGLIEELAGLGLLAEVEPVAGVGAADEFTLGLRRSFRLSYCYEWCPEMWKAGALHVLRLLAVLADFELTLQSPRPANLLFEGPRPVYVNPASITHLTGQTFRRTLEELSEFFLYPVVLSLSGRSHLARRLLRGVGRGISAEDVPEVGGVAGEVAAWVETLSPADCLRKLESEVEGMRIADAGSDWSDYYSADAPLVPAEGWSDKQREVYRVLTELRPASVLDLACNVGWYSRLAATAAADIVAVDFDETCVNRLYRRVRAEQGGVLPLMMDINDPSPGFGVGNGWLAPASERLGSDLVLALAVSHHLIFSGMRLNLGELARAFAPFVKRWLLIEFIPFDSRGMIYSAEDRPESAGWYNLESFASALAAQFSGVEVLPGAPLSRRLILCERPGSQSE